MISNITVDLKNTFKKIQVGWLVTVTELGLLKVGHMMSLWGTGPASPPENKLGTKFCVKNKQKNWGFKRNMWIFLLQKKKLYLNWRRKNKKFANWFLILIKPAYKKKKNHTRAGPGTGLDRDNKFLIFEKPNYKRGLREQCSKVLGEVSFVLFRIKASQSGVIIRVYRNLVKLGRSLQ